MHRNPDGPYVEHLAPVAGVLMLLDGLSSDQVTANRALAMRAAGIADVLDLARRHPEVYTDLHGEAGAASAVRAAALDIALRLQLSESLVRGLGQVAASARTHLPALWSRARDGFVAMPLVEASVAGAARLDARIGASPEAVARAAHVRAALDEACAEWAMTCTPAAYRKRLAALLEHLDPERPEVRHTRAMRDRRVVFDDAGDGMTWLSALVSTLDAVAIKRRLTSTAKNLQNDRREPRSRDQIRADLLSSWLRGIGTPTAVKTKIFVTVPLSTLVGSPSTDAEGTASAQVVCTGPRPRSSRIPEAPRIPDLPRIVGHGPIDPLTATQLFFEATSFRRALTDPFTGAVLDLDPRNYRPTKAQREYLILRHGTCPRDGCTRLALDADIDHDLPWSRGGPTETRNLRPLCPPDHTHRHSSRTRYRTRPDGSVEVTTPTGYTTPEQPPF